VFTHLNDIENYAEDIYETFDNVLERVIGFRCKKCGKEFKVSLTAVKNSKYSELLSTPDQRINFARVLNSGYILSPEMVKQGINEF
jgi:hypothetical protein